MRYLRSLLATAALAAAGCPGPAPQPPTPTLPTGGAIPGDDPRPVTGGNGGTPAPTGGEPGPQPQELEVADEPFRAEQPSPGKPRPLNIPAIQSFVLDNGIRAYLVERHELPVVTTTLVFDGGAINDPAAKDGLAGICMELLTEGTQALEKIAYNEALADIASRISSFAGSEEQGLSMSTLSKHLDTTHGLFVDVLLRPGLRQADLDRLIKRRIEGIKQSRGSAASVSRRVGGSVLYGEAHPFGRVQMESALAAITLDDCRAYHAAWVKPQGARLFIAGDLTRAQVAERFGAAALAGWKGKRPAGVAVPQPRTRAGRIFFVHVPGAQQSEVQVMHFGPMRKAPDFFANTLVSQIFGGGFSSRINMNLREGKGYTYGARGGFGYSRRYGTLDAGASVRSDATWQSVVEIWNEMTGLDSGKLPVKPEELAREKNGNILALPAGFATMDQVLGAYRDLVYFGLPLDYYKSYVGKMQGVTLAQVGTSARKHLAPEKAVILVVGDAGSPQIQRVVEDGKPVDKPLLHADGKPVTLRDAMQRLVDKGGPLAGGTLVVLDADGKPAK